MRIYVSEHDKAPAHHEPLWETLIDLLRAEGAAGATLLGGLAGFGAHSRLKTARLADVAPDLPLIIEWIDGPERVERLLPRICELVEQGTITLEDVALVKYTHRAPRPLPPDTVAQVMTRQVVSVPPGARVPDVVRLLLDHEVRAIPVVEADGRLVGIITNTDLVDRGGLSGRLELLSALGGRALQHLEAETARARTAADLMSRPVVTIRPEAPLPQAAHLMVERHVKRLPVTDAADRLVGMLSRVDLLRTMGEDYPAPAPGSADAATAGRRPSTIGALMHQQVPTVLATAPLGEVLDAVTSTRLNRAIVVDAERRVLGVVSDAELLARLERAGGGLPSGLLAALMGRGRRSQPLVRLTAAEVMRRPITSVPADLPVAEAARRMLAARQKVLPITDPAGRLLGAVDRGDFLPLLV